MIHVHRLAVGLAFLLAAGLIVVSLPWSLLLAMAYICGWVWLAEPANDPYDVEDFEP